MLLRRIKLPIPDQRDLLGRYRGGSFVSAAAHPQWRDHLDAARIGGFGASLGGETMMLLGGTAGVVAPLDQIERLSAFQAGSAASSAAKTRGAAATTRPPAASPPGSG